MGEVGSFLRGKSILKSDFIEDGMPCIHYGQVHTKFGVSVNQHISEISDELYKKSIIAAPGDTIIAITSEDLEGSCKSTDWLGDYDVAVSAHAAVYKHKFAPKFIPYYLRSRSFYVEKEKYARGFKVMEIKPTDLARIPVPVPSLEEQTIIVAELDGINDSIAMLRQQIEEFDNLEKSLFYRTFGDPITNPFNWPIKNLGENCQLSAGGDVPKIHVKEKTIDCQVPIYSNGIEKEGLYGYTSNAKIHENCVTISGRGTIGVPFIRSTPFVPVIRLIVAIPNEAINNTYLYFWVKSKNYKGNGGAIPQLTVPMLKNEKVPIPPLSIQKSFATQVASIEESKGLLNAQIMELQNLLDARMQYWFE